MIMRTYNPRLAELLETIEKQPTPPALRTFGAITDAIRSTHNFYLRSEKEFQEIYTDIERDGKLTNSGLNDLRADFDEASKRYKDGMSDVIRDQVKRWKENELRNVFEVVNKAPSDDQARKLEVILKRDGLTASEVELWAKEFGSNYLCASAFRDYAEKQGYIITFSDFTNADDRMNDINTANDYLLEMLSVVGKEDLTYPQMCFFGTDENGKSYDGSLAAVYSEALDRDVTFKGQDQEIEIKRKEAE